MSYPSSAAAAAPYPPGQGPPPPQAGGAPIPDSYFTESRKGEINELRNLLRGFATEKDPQRKRDIIKKVIAYMTLGIDVSRLFTEMMLAIETRDLVIKKMVYLYLTNYARTHPDLAQMCTNTLQKDCGNEDPMVRGLALRALCGLSLPQMVEYISEPLRRSLSDGHPYVRKTGVMGILKLFHLDADAFESSGFVDILYDMLRDPDASVVANCIVVLNEVMQKSPVGGMAINRAIMLHLLNRIHEFNEFAKVQVLELVPRYIPANEEEGYQIMNLLDPVLRTSSSGATMATIRAFLSLAEHLAGDDLPGMQRQIVQRIKAPIVTQISSGSSETMYTLLKHVDTLADLCPGVFDDEYRQFYVRYNEPTYVKYLKLNILPKMASVDTAPDIVTELHELVSDHNVKLSRLAVRSLGKIGCSHRGGPGCAESIARRLVDMLDLNIEHVSSEAATALLLMIRKHPASLQPLVAPPLVRSLKYITESTGKASIIHLLAECGDQIPEAPYALEKLIDRYDDLKDDVTVKMALLTATVKLFVQRPPEVQRMLGRLLAKATDDVCSQDLHDRALCYYRLLKSADGSTLQSVVQTSTFVAGNVNFAEEVDPTLQKELLEEFNTLSVLYGKPAHNFIAPPFQTKFVKMPEEHPLQHGDSGIVHSSMGGAAMAAQPPPQHQQPQQPISSSSDLGGDVDLLGFGGGGSPMAVATSSASVSSSNSSSGRIISLNPSASMTGAEYEKMWGSVQDADSIVSTIALRSLPANTDQVERALAAVNVMTMASGELPNEFRIFLYAQDTLSGCFFLMRANIDKSSPQDPLMIVTVKVSGKGNGTDHQVVNQLIETMSKMLVA